MPGSAPAGPSCLWRLPSDAVTPEGLEERLRQRVLAAAPQAEKRIFRPRGYVRKAVLAAVLAVILTISAGAAVLLGWDKVFSRRFGEEAAQTPMGQAALQDVFVSSVCDDVTLTVRQALVSDKTIYLVLDYQLPDTVDPGVAPAAPRVRAMTRRPIPSPIFSASLQRPKPSP